MRFDRDTRMEIYAVAQFVVPLFAVIGGALHQDTFWKVVFLVLYVGLGILIIRAYKQKSKPKSPSGVKDKLLAELDEAILDLRRLIEEDKANKVAVPMSPRHYFTQLPYYEMLGRRIVNSLAVLGTYGDVVGFALPPELDHMGKVELLHSLEKSQRKFSQLHS